MSNTKVAEQDVRERALLIYELEGAEEAGRAVNVSKRTVQRWAAEAGVSYEYQPPLLPCPSAASYVRGCRCDGCVEANRERQRSVKERRVAYGKKHNRKHDGNPIPHGVSGYSNWDCRCPRCKNAWSTYLREKRAARALGKTD